MHREQKELLKIRFSRERKQYFVERYDYSQNKADPLVEQSRDFESKALAEKHREAWAKSLCVAKDVNPDDVDAEIAAQISGALIRKIGILFRLAENGEFEEFCEETQTGLGDMTHRAVGPKAQASLAIATGSVHRIKTAFYHDLEDQDEISQNVVNETPIEVMPKLKQANRSTLMFMALGVRDPIDAAVVDAAHSLMDEYLGDEKWDAAIAVSSSVGLPMPQEVSPVIDLKRRSQRKFWKLG